MPCRWEPHQRGFNSIRATLLFLVSHLNRIIERIGQGHRLQWFRNISSPHVNWIRGPSLFDNPKKKKKLLSWLDIAYENDYAERSATKTETPGPISALNAIMEENTIDKTIYSANRAVNRRRNCDGTADPWEERETKMETQCNQEMERVTKDQSR